MEKVAVTFASPQMLWLLAATLPLLTWFLWWAWRKKQQLIAQFVQSRLLAQLTVGVSPLRQKVRLALFVLAVGCLIAALARPQWGYDWEEAKQRGLGIVVAIDTSRSMLAADVRPDRLTRAKLAALDLMKQARTDRLGLVAFAGDAFLQCPLTLDEDAFRQSVDVLEAGIIPQGGTALTAAIETTLTAFKDEGENFKILVLFTDGEDHDSGALEAAQKAASAGLRIFTVGVGTPNGELLRVTDDNGAVNYIKDERGTAVKSRLNETLLQQIATASRGFYLPLRAANAIETLYDKGLAPLPKGEISARLVRRYHERFQWPLALAIVLLSVEMLLPERRRVSRTETIVNAPSAELRKAVVLLWLVVLPSAALVASPASARRLYDTGKYRKAQEEYERLLQKDGGSAAKQAEDAGAAPGQTLENSKSGDPRLLFNAGAAAYKAGDLESAKAHFARVATAPDLDLQQQAYYNLGNTLYRLGEKKQELDRKIEAWEMSVAGFAAATNLHPQDADARYNLEVVKKKLEELKKQQRQQNQGKDGDNKNQEKQDQDKQDEQKQEQGQQKPQPEDKSPDSSQQKQEQDPKPDQNQRQDRSQNQQPQKPQEQEREAQEDKSSAGQQKQQDQKGSQDKSQGNANGEEKPGDPARANAAQMPAGQMTLQEAQQLLDSLKGDEQALIFVPAKKGDSGNRAFKDW